MKKGNPVGVNPLFVILLVLGLSGCKNPLTSSVESSVDSLFDNDSAPPLGLNQPLATINTTNAAAYPISGNCTANTGVLVTVTIGTPDAPVDFPCDANGEFSGTMDLTTVTSSPVTITLEQGAFTESITGVDAPINDQTAIVGPPTATTPTGISGAPSFSLDVVCSEIGEVITLTGAGLTPSPQSVTCSAIGPNTVTVFSQFSPAVELVSPNLITLTSEDENGNPTDNAGSVDIPIDTQGPTVAITNGGDINQGETGSFTITVTDAHISTFNYMYSVELPGEEPLSFTCTANPCLVTTAIAANPGTLTITVGSGSVDDDASNSNATAVSDTIAVADTTDPTIVATSITSTDGDTDTWYEEADTIEIAVEFSESVIVDTAGGTPTIPVTLTSGAKVATYTSGTGTSILVFTMPVVANDLQCDGVLALGALATNLGTIRDAADRDSDNSGLAATVSGAMVDTVVPTLAGTVTVSNDAFLSEASTASWTATPTDACGVTTDIHLALGTHDGATCNLPEDIVSYVNVGAVVTIQPISDTAPFDAANTFSLERATQYCTSVVVQDSAGNISAPISSAAWDLFDPLDITGAVAWYDLADVTTVMSDGACTAAATEGGIVNCILDKTSNGNDLVNKAGSVDPTYNLSTGSVKFYDDGVSVGSGLFTDVNASLGFTEYSYFARAESSSNSDVQVLLSNREASDENGFSLFLDPSLQLQSGIWDGATNITNIGAVVTAATSFVGYEAFSNTVSWDTAVDGVEVAETPITGIIGTSQILSLGSNLSGSFGWDGTVSEVIVYDSALSASDRALVNKYVSGD